MRIGPYLIDPPVVLAPMAGVTDKPFRQLCKRLGAGLAVSEMTTADPRLWTTRKSLKRMDHVGEPDAGQRADRRLRPGDARRGGALQRRSRRPDHRHQHGLPGEEGLQRLVGQRAAAGRVARRAHLDAVVNAVDVPVTLKIRTGWNRENRNGVRIAKIAEDAGIAALAVHGRTRADHYQGEAEYETIAAIKAAIRIPVFANGDVDSPQKATAVLDFTKCDAVMIGRAAQGRPWIFREIAHYPRDRRNRSRRRRPPKCATSCSAISTICTRSTASSRACASRASISAGMRRIGRKTRRFARWSIAPKAPPEQMRLTRDYFDALAADATARVRERPPDSLAPSAGGVHVTQGSSSQPSTSRISA